jgi:hypothetical protein
MLPGRQVTSARLTDVLLTAREINTVMGTDMSADGIEDRVGETVAVFDAALCGLTLYNANIAVYKDAGYSDTRTQRFKHPASGPRDAVVFQSAFLFPSPTKASELVDATGKKLSEPCLGKTETLSDGSTWMFKRIEDCLAAGFVCQGSQFRVDATMLQSGERPYACQKMMRAEGKVAIEVLVCRNSGWKGNEAFDIADKMAGKVTDLTAWPRRWFP